MSHEIEINAGVASMAYAETARPDIWHRLGQEIAGRAMTADEAMRAANMDRAIRVLPAALPDGVDEWGIERPNLIVLDGKMAVGDDGTLIDIPAKVVGVAGKSGGAAHETFSMLDRFELAEEAIHASHGAAVWSTAGMLRSGTQGFATMESPATVIDPNGVADVIRNYLTVSWSFDASRPTILAGSNVRVVCANTLRAHDSGAVEVIKVKHTAGAKDRMRLAAQHWAQAQDEVAALRLQAERMLAVRDGRKVLGRILETVNPRPTAETGEPSKRAVTEWEKRQDAITTLYYAPTNEPAVGDNGWAAYNAVVEYLDWESAVRCGEGENDADRRMANQFDGIWNDAKAVTAGLILAAAD
jgi:phage/plasmid-like protein (TIGR03299 family)